MNSKYPDGFPDLSPTLARELHNTKRIASRVTALAQKIRQFGGWLIFECPSTRGNKQRLGLYDPAFDLHSGVMGLEYYREIIDKGATIVHAHMCKLREGYPQKPEDYIISDNIVLGLGEALNSLRCTHPGNAGLTTKSSQVWVPELCDLLWEHVEKHTYKGGPSLQLGVDDLTKFAMNELHWRISDKVLALAGCHTELLEKVIETKAEHEINSQHEKALAIIYETLDHHDHALPAIDFDYDSAVDANDEANVLMVIIDSKLMLVPVTEAKEKMPAQLLPPDLDHDWCLATIHVPCEDWVAPQTEKEFKLSRQNLFWCNTDDRTRRSTFSSPWAYSRRSPTSSCPWALTASRFASHSPTRPVRVHVSAETARSACPKGGSLGRQVGRRACPELQLRHARPARPAGLRPTLAPQDPARAHRPGHQGVRYLLRGEPAHQPGPRPGERT
eukprot:6417769-Prymnesium_polylepis.1